MKLVSSRLAGASTLVEEPSARYDSASIFLHWTTAALVVVLWLVGEFIDDFARGTPRIMARSTHIALGVALALVISIRIAWRASSGRRLPLAVPGALGYAARIVHYGLYVLIAAPIALGLVNVWVRGDSIFGLFSVPRLAPGNGDLKETIEELHEWFANAVLIVAALHVAAALFHRYVLRDEVLRRMLPERVRK
jgi:cytochrome b561